ncbi:hypothetical protein A2955_00475 [Candidatus Woesebacteria bacterium RIFCSPLOWO2_01_FULL_37_19]|uniref:ChsH2 C-terminal OB-fold domain-containing protein n=2 Tax=Candidatus Woeseibacteriota TaxID=1752722 RepID=A0A1F8AZY6_9BACT|nr:MAG: hypothetical protein A2771_01500 [Candidatus Woesebacteria bacterium RIFCSPHIGHO2_01_FULL_38_26b]OGM57311.1 MAG: hypothetical protein A2955_00475 [Candidatus Woesebacteria bacterium RIFCSPLOWO2_01_FULL_37_19]
MKENPKAIDRMKYKFSGRGKIWAFTVIGNRDHAPEGFQNQVPYAVAIIELDEGPKISSMLTDLEWHYNEGIKKPNIEIDDEVEMVTRKLRVLDDEERGLIVYGYKFRPAGLK